jgi:aspartyl-tRNA(Asn)/glutamyl-tRNA(Gln) amidotransferase subunit A
MTDQLANLGLCEAADAVARGEVTSEQLTRVALDRLHTLGTQLNCVASLNEDAALASARQADIARSKGETLGVLHGVPMAHKELFYRQGRPSNDGSIITQGFIPDVTSTALTRLDQAGAIDLGLLHMAEFAMSPTGFNLHYGHVRNPWRLDACPGGSSSGSGAAVGARLTYASLGTDTGGSIRHPSVMCGITGLKPTWSRVSAFGLMPLSKSLDCVGPLARSARDCARMLKVTAGHDPLDALSSAQAVPDYEAMLDGDVRGMKIAIPGGYYREHLDAGVAACLDEAERVFTSLGATIIRTEPPDMAVINRLMSVVITVEAASHHKHWIAQRPQDYAEQVLARFKPGFDFTGIDYYEAISTRAEWTRKWLAMCVRDADCALLPTIPVPVPSIEETTEGDWGVISQKIATITHCNRGINYLGLPSLSVPAGLVKDMPAAFQLVGCAFDEGKLLRLGHAFQTVTQWHQMVPTWCASQANTSK